jgi:hypothetical protein
MYKRPEHTWCLQRKFQKDLEQGANYDFHWCYFFNVRLFCLFFFGGFYLKNPLLLRFLGYGKPS